jgi:hypothetical protein
MITTKKTNQESIHPNGSGSEKSVSRIPKDCQFYHFCSANICPLDPLVTSLIWLPEEDETDEICKNPEFANLQFIMTQKKIKKALRNRTGERDDFFTYEMLNRKITVRSGIRSIPSDPPGAVKNSKAWYVNKEKAWNAKHPERKKLSEENIKKLTSHLRKKEA